MVCIECGEKTHVTNSRQGRRGASIWRRRHCYNCEATFTTIELPELASSWVVTSSDGSVQPFSRDKLFLSLYKSCEHRPTSITDAGGVTTTVINKLGAQVQGAALSRQLIIQTVQVALNRFDRAASTHYAAFHPA